MILVDGFGMIVGIGAEVALLQVIKEQDDIFIQVFLVLFERQQIVSSLLDNCLGNLSLTAHGINRHQAALQIQQLQELGDRRDLVRLFIDFLLTQHQPVGRGPGTHHVDRPLPQALVKRTPQGLPVNRYHLPLGHLADSGYPPAEA